MLQIEIKCPKCGMNNPLYLTGEVNLVILNCGSCKTPLMFHENQVYEVDKIKIDKLKFDAGNGEQMEKMQKFFTDIQHLSDKAREPKSAKKYFPIYHRNQVAPGAAVQEGPREIISRDDIMNLKIDLATSGSVTEFLRRLG